VLADFEILDFFANGFICKSLRARCCFSGKQAGPGKPDQESQNQCGQSCGPPVVRMGRLHSSQFPKALAASSAAVPPRRLDLSGAGLSLSVFVFVKKQASVDLVVGVRGFCTTWVSGSQEILPSIRTLTYEAKLSLDPLSYRSCQGTSPWLLA